MSKSNTKTNEAVVESKVDQFSKVGMEQLMKDHKNVSGVIRFLNSEGLTRGEIAKVTGKKYQHVRNVLITPVGAQTKTAAQ